MILFFSQYGHNLFDLSRCNKFLGLLWDNQGFELFITSGMTPRNYILIID
uniref:Uncharacterized protein n=1 Tax=Rhizophora mucronata TaxID=61149 RepID=A0A2P2PSE6_RHIMU